MLSKAQENKLIKLCQKEGGEGINRYEKHLAAYYKALDHGSPEAFLFASLQCENDLKYMEDD